MDNTLNENIKKLRVSNGLSQVELAKKLCVSKQCVSNWENGNVQPSIEMLLKIADFFNVSTDYLLGRFENDVLTVKGLTAEQAAHIKAVIRDICNANRK